MLSHYIKIAWRNILRKKLFAAINILGLAIGLAVCIVIFLIIRHELSYDKFHAGSNRIYRVYTTFSGAFEATSRGVVSTAADYVEQNLTGVELVVPFHAVYTEKIRIDLGEGQIEEFDRDKRIIATVPAYFDLINYEWLYGSSHDLFAMPNRVVLTLSKVKKYFGSSMSPDEVIGKSIIYRDSIELIVYGVVNDLQYHTDFDFSEFISIETASLMSRQANYYNEWSNTNSSSQLFLKLNEGMSADNFSSGLALLAEEYRNRNKDVGWEVGYQLQPLSDLHFTPQMGIFDHSRQPPPKATLKTLVGVAALILILASINFVNLETAQASRRAKEIGVRKVMGSTRNDIIFQFLTESTLAATLAVTLALPIVQLALGWLNEFIPDGLSFELLDPAVWFFLILIVGFVGLAAGFYPAFIISGLQPAKALKSMVFSDRGANRAALLRKCLIVFQFVFTQILIAGCLIIIWQNDYMSNKDLGFAYDEVINIYLPFREPPVKGQSFLNALAEIPQISSLSRHGEPPAADGYSSSMVKFRSDSSEVSLNVFRKEGTEDYFDFYDMPLIAGRAYMPADSSHEVVINTTLARQLGLEPDQALGKQIDWNGTATIVGVINDVNFRSLHHSVEPMMVTYSEEGYCVSLKFDQASTTNIEQVIQRVESAWIGVFPNRPFQYSFLNETIDRFYKSERRTSKLVATSTGIAVIISCMGLFGLVSFTAVQRTKEIGIRKVLGATVSNIVVLLSTDFLRLVLVAFVVACPVAYWLGTVWLEEFAYRIEIGPQLFIYTGLLATSIALVTVAQQAFKAATENPVKALRNE